MSEADTPRGPGVEADIVRIMQMIPHRSPFLMIDRVVDMYADKKGKYQDQKGLTLPIVSGSMRA